MRLILADDSVLFREGLARVLAEVGFEIVAQAGDGEALLRELRAHRAELAIVSETAFWITRSIEICMFDTAVVSGSSGLSGNTSKRS